MATSPSAKPEQIQLTTEYLRPTGVCQSVDGRRTGRYDPLPFRADGPHQLPPRHSENVPEAQTRSDRGETVPSGALSLAVAPRGPEGGGAGPLPPAARRSEERRAEGRHRQTQPAQTAGLTVTSPSLSPRWSWAHLSHCRGI